MAAKEVDISIFGLESGMADEVKTDLSDAFHSATAFFGSLNGAMKSNLRTALREMRDKIYEKMTDGATYIINDTHSLAELAKLGHPYSRMTPHFEGMHTPNEVYHIQHTRGYSMFDSAFMVKMDDDEKLRYTIGFNNALLLERWRWLKYGTSRMAPRDLEARIYADHKDEYEARFRKIGPTAFKEAVENINHPKEGWMDSDRDFFMGGGGAHAEGGIEYDEYE